MTGQIWIAVVIGVSALRRNRMRALLTMLGMIVGVASVIGVAAVGSGAKQAIEDRITASGANMIVVRAVNRTIGGATLSRAPTNSAFVMLSSLVVAKTALP